MINEFLEPFCAVKKGDGRSKRLITTQNLKLTKRLVSAIVYRSELEHELQYVDDTYVQYSTVVAL